MCVPLSTLTADTSKVQNNLRPSASVGNPAGVPLGDGTAARARIAISGRQRQIDNAVEAAQKGR